MAQYAVMGWCTVAGDGGGSIQRSTATTATGGRPPPGISAASFQFEEGEEPDEPREEEEEADREKHDCSSILMVAAAAVLLYAIAKQAEDETLSHPTPPSFVTRAQRERERIYSACALTNREGGEMTSGEEEGGRANKKRPRRAKESPQSRGSSSPSVPLFLAPLKFG